MGKNRKVALVVAAALLFAALPTAVALAADTASVLEEILTIMRQSGQITEEQKKTLLERAEREAREATAAREQDEQQRRSALLAGVEKGRPFLRSADDTFRLELGGRLQVDFAGVEDRGRTLTGPTLNDQFLVRRGRIELSGTFYRWIDFRLESEFVNSPSLNDAYLDFRFVPELAVRAGQFKVPFSLEELWSDNLLDFVERSVVDELAPSRDVGASLHGSLLSGVVGYDVGVFNGTPLNTPDTNNGKDVAGRVALLPFKPTGNYWLKGLQLAADATWGVEGNGTSAQGRTMARTAKRFVFFAPQPTQGDRTRWGTDLLWVVGPASFKFEYNQQLDQRRRLGASGRNLDEITATGWYVSATYLLTGEDKALSGLVEPRHPFSPLRGEFGLGAWELAVRYAELRFDSDSPVDFLDGNINNGITGGGRSARNGVEALTAGLNWYFNSRVRYMFNWTEYWYDNRLGTPFSCESLSCTATQLRRRDDPTSWEVLSRVQMWF